MDMCSGGTLTAKKTWKCGKLHILIQKFNFQCVTAVFGLARKKNLKMTEGVFISTCFFYSDSLLYCHVIQISRSWAKRILQNCLQIGHT
jgi:hypothetical protein